MHAASIRYCTVKISNKQENNSERINALVQRRDRLAIDEDWFYTKPLLAGIVAIVNGIFLSFVNTAPLDFVTSALNQRFTFVVQSV